MESSQHLLVRGRASAEAAGSSEVTGNGNLDGSGALQQITVVRIDDSHIAGEPSHLSGWLTCDTGAYDEVEYTVPTEEEVVVGGRGEEDDSVYVIEYSNPEEEGDSYHLTMSIDRSVQAKGTMVKHPVDREFVRAPPPARKKVSAALRPRRRRRVTEAEVKGQAVVSNRSLLEFGEDYNDIMESRKRSLVCSLCPPPPKVFKKASGLAVHLKHMHFPERMQRKCYVCVTCKQTLRSQTQLDTHTRRHAREDAIFTCPLCTSAAGSEAEASGFKGSKLGLRLHLQNEHPGVIPECDICNRSFKTLQSYLGDQFRHVGVSPFYCSKCQIYEMTERGLTVHIRNHKKKQEGEEEESPPPETHQLTAGVSTSTDHSATDDSDF